MITMLNKNKLPSTKTLLFLVITVYSVLCLAAFQYTRMTADSMLYFSLAEKYINGDFANAINGYWGPLLAWLLVPFLYFGVSDVNAINLLDLFVGVLTFIGVWKLSGRLEVSDGIKSVLMVCLLPIVLRFSLVQPMDFILACILIFYLNTVFNSDYQKSVGSGLSCGMLGSMAYLTKAYAFPFFIVHFLVMNILHYFKSDLKDEKKRVLRNAVAGFLLFALISGAWICLISDKYGHITFSTMRDTNFNAPGPDDMDGGLEFGVPVFTEGFYEPPNETAFVIWEDPSYLRGKPWSPFDSARHFKHFIRLTLKNVSDGLKIFESFSTFSITIIVVYILLCCVGTKKELLSKGTLLYPLFTIILFSGGYILFHFEERYVWLTNILLLVMGGYLLTDLFRRDFFRSALRRNILIVFFIVSFIFVPAKYVMQVGRGGMDIDMYLMSTALNKYNISGNIASNREMDSHDAWHKTFRLAYWLDARYYGQAREGIDDDSLKTELKKYDIDYYFVWGEADAALQFLSQYNELTEGEIPGLSIFSINEKKGNAKQQTFH